MHSMKQASLRQSPRYYVFTLLLLVFAGGASPRTASGQWTANSTSGNDIHNTNTGNVGIGTGATPPGDKLVAVGNGIFGGALNRTNLWDAFALYNVKSAGAAGTGHGRNPRPSEPPVGRLINYASV
jgi:hypothetical protein